MMNTIDSKSSIKTAKSLALTSLRCESINDYNSLPPALFVKVVQALTLADAVQIDSPTRMQLSQLVKHEAEAEEFLATQVMAIGDYLDKPMSMLKACQLVADFVQKYWYYTLNDVLLMLKRGRQGYYNEDGQISVQFNAHTVMAWAGKYEVERTEYISTMRIKESQAYKSTIAETQLPQDLYKGATYDPENAGRKAHLKDRAYKAYKADYIRHKKNGTLSTLINPNP